MIAPRRLVPLAEQALVSGTNFTYFVLLARQLSRDEWGVYSLAYALCLFMQGFQRALVVIPFTTTMTTAEEVLEHGVHWWRRQFGVTTACTGTGIVCCSISVMVLGRAHWLTGVLAATALMSVPLFLYEFLRRWHVQLGQQTKLIPLALGYAAIVVPVGAVQGSTTQATSTAVLFSFGLSAFFVPLTVRAYQATRKRASSKPFDPKIFSKAKWNVLSHIAYAGYTTGIQILLASLGSIGAQAVFSATRNLVQPLNVLMGALDTVDKPKASRAYRAEGLSGVWRVIAHTLKILAVLGGIYLCAAVLIGELVLEWLYGTKYADAGTEVTLWALCYCVMMLTMPLETAIYVFQKTDALFVNRMLALVIGIGLAVYTIPNHGAVGALVAWLCAWTGGGALAALQLAMQRRRIRRTRA